MTNGDTENIRRGTLVQDDNGSQASAYRADDRQAASGLVAWRDFIARTDKIEERIQNVEKHMNDRMKKLEIDNSYRQGRFKTWEVVAAAIWTLLIALLSFLITKCITSP